MSIVRVQARVHAIVEELMLLAGGGGLAGADVADQMLVRVYIVDARSALDRLERRVGISIKR